MAGKLDRLLGDFAWDRMDRVYADLLCRRRRRMPTPSALPRTGRR